MTHEELLRKAYIGETVPGFIHNIGNPLGALLGFVELIREESVKLREGVQRLPESGDKKRLQDSCGFIAEFLTIAIQSETSLREILEQLVAKCNKDASDEIVEIPLVSLVRLESDVLATNKFFKHKITKQFSYAEEIPSAWGVWRIVSQPVGSILSLYTLALQTVTSPSLHVQVRADGGKPEIVISANARLAEHEEAVGPSFPPILTLDECSRTLSPLATVTYELTEGNGSRVRITFSESAEEDLYTA